MGAPEHSVAVRFGDERLPERVWRDVYPLEDGCWAWAGALGTRGYGQFWWRGKTERAHRVLYFELIGPWSAEPLDHLCRRPICVNPAHLEPVPVAENTRRAYGVTARACGRGHPRTPENERIYRRPTYLERRCRVCELEAHRANRARSHKLLVGGRLLGKENAVNQAPRACVVCGALFIPDQGGQFECGQACADERNDEARALEEWREQSAAKDRD